MERHLPKCRVVWQRDFGKSRSLPQPAPQGGKHGPCQAQVRDAVPRVLETGNTLPVSRIPGQVRRGGGGAHR